REPGEGSPRRTRGRTRSPQARPMSLERGIWLRRRPVTPYAAGSRTRDRPGPTVDGTGGRKQADGKHGKDRDPGHWVFGAKCLRRQVSSVPVLASRDRVAVVTSRVRDTSTSAPAGDSARGAFMPTPHAA